MHIAVFTAVDGTLLDAAAIRRLQAAGIPVIPMSTLPLEEIAPIAADLGLRHPMVIEAGGAIARWKDGHWDIEPCGPDADTLLDVVTEIEDRSGAQLLVYAATAEMLCAPSRRCFSEPFLIESGDLAAIERAAADLGFSIRRGRRFFHLCRQCDEGVAFNRLRAELRCDLAIAVGGAPIDGEFLTRADIAIVVPGPDGTVDSELLSRVPAARIASAGWAVAVEEAVG